MTRYESGLSNMSYTNKDFEAVYTELLDLATKLSYKWNPAISDESDPGVVLLKLAAIIADKDNYNIDKNILELFPLSVSQETNARQLFDQCGYAMKYYQAATTELKFTMQSEPEITQSDFVDMNPTGDFLTEWSEATDEDKAKPELVRTYIIPMFTMVADVDNEHVFTTLEETRVSSTGVWAFASAMQGIITDYIVNGSSTLTSANLDANHRLYFVDTDVAENGIFISNKISTVTTTNAAGEEVSTSSFVNFDEWEKVDNLAIQPTGKLCYKFGIAEDGVTCYIEFPLDIEDLIGSGFCVKYIRTLGFNGNIGRKRLAQFYTDTTVNRYFDTDTEHVNSTILTAEHVYVTNELPVTNGLDPETIDEAYKNYERVKTVFNTLVSTKDYSNYIITNQLVSNAFVCDRTDDIQSSYKILETNDEYEKTHTIVKDKWTKVEDAKLNPDGSGADTTVYIKSPELEAIDLKIYALRYVDTPTTPAAFVKSFDVLVDTDSIHGELYRVKKNAGVQELKHTQHNFIKSLVNEPLMIKNKYPICAKIIPQYKLDVAQQKEVITRVNQALYKVLNSRQLKFGEEASYDVIYDTIMAADPRIKALALDDIQYETFVQYINENNELCEVRIDDYPDDNLASYIDTIKHQRGGKTVIGYNAKEKEIRDKFRTDIYVKSVLAGVTQFLKPVDDFSYSLEQTNKADSKIVTSIYSAKTINTETKHTLNKIENSLKWESPNAVKENEHIMFTAPNLVTEQNYSSYVKYVYHLASSKVERKSGDSVTEVYSNIKKDTNYQLTGEDFIIFFWKTEDDELAPYRYKKYTAMPQSGSTKQKPAADVIHFNFNLIQDEVNGQPLPTERMGVGTDAAYMNFIEDIPLEGTTDELGDVPVGETRVSMTQYVKSLTGSNFNLTGTNAITTKKPNTIDITNDKNGTRSVCWILNNTNENSGAVLFTEGETEYTLQSGEYIMYANEKKTHLVMLGVGTTIKRTMLGTLPTWSVKPIDYGQLLSEGMSYLDDKWFTVPEGATLEATENEFYQIGPGNKIKLDSHNGRSNSNLNDVTEIYFTTSGIHNSSVTDAGADSNITEEFRLHDYQISYTDSTTGVETKIPIRNTADYGWKPAATLNLDMSPEKPMVLSAEQSVTLSPGNITLNDCSLVSNRAVATVGGRNVDVTTIDPQTGEIVPLMIYIYSPNKSNVAFMDEHDQPLSIGNTSTNPWSFDNNELTSTLKISYDLAYRMANGAGDLIVAGKPQLEKTTLNFDGDNDQYYNYAVDVCVPTGNYVIPVKIANPYRPSTNSSTTRDSGNSTPVCKLIEFSYWSEFGNLYKLNELHNKNVKENGQYFIKMETSIDDEIEFKLTSDGWLAWNRSNHKADEMKITPVSIELDATNYNYGIESIKVSGSTYQVTVNQIDKKTDEVVDSEVIDATLFVSGRLYICIKLLSAPAEPSDATTDPWNKLPLSFYFGKLYRYEVDPSAPDSFEKLHEQINRQDPNSFFNYTYIVPEDILISNPLKSSSFVVSQHVMNPYTIVQWDIYNTDKIIQVSSKVK